MGERRDPKWKPIHAPTMRVAAGIIQWTMAFAEPTGAETEAGELVGWSGVEDRSWVVSDVVRWADAELCEKVTGAIKR